MKIPNEASLDELEKHVWQDVSRARASHAVLQQFLKPLGQQSSRHYRNRDVPLISAIAHAAVDSIIAALGRLLQPNPRDRESTIRKYMNRTITRLRERGAVSDASSYSKQSFNELSDRTWINAIKKEQVKLTQEILPLRDK